MNEPAILVSPSPRELRWLSYAKPLSLLALGILIGLLFRGRAATTTASDAPTVADEGPITVRLRPDLAQRAGIQTTVAAPSPFVPEVALVGTVRFDDTRVADVGGRIAGRVTRFFVELGDHVEAGEPVAEIEGAEIGAAVAELLSAEAHLAAASHQAEREAGLVSQQLTTATVAEDARARAAALAADVRGAEQRLVAMGASPNAVRTRAQVAAPVTRVVLRAPIAGDVVERFALLGQVVDPTHPLLRVADLSQVWVQLDVYERDLARVAEGDAAVVATEAMPGVLFRGQVSHIDSTIDERTRTARVRVAVPNTERRLRPGQFVDARLSPQSGARMAIVVDPTSVTQIDGEDCLFVATSADTYEVREVDLGAHGDGVVEIVSGIHDGDRIVVSGAFALKSELAR